MKRLKLYPELLDPDPQAEKIGRLESRIEQLEKLAKAYVEAYETRTLLPPRLIADIWREVLK